jgi:hypothetical protein
MHHQSPFWLALKPSRVSLVDMLAQPDAGVATVTRCRRALSVHRNTNAPNYRFSSVAFAVLRRAAFAAQRVNAPEERGPISEMAAMWLRWADRAEFMSKVASGEHPRF